MDSIEFEKKFLSLVNQTDVVITAPNVAYHLELGIEEAQEHLLSLELNGTLQQRTDESGDSFYIMPNRQLPGTPRAQLAAEAGADDGGGPPGSYNPADLPSAPVYASPSTAPARGRNINGLVLNILVPGVGSLVCGRPAGLAMLGLIVVGLLLLFILPGWSKLLAVLPVIAGWIWSIIAGIGLLDEREPHPGTPRR